MEECISVFDMLKIGVGPSSSHTLGPWRAAERFLKELRSEKLIETVSRIKTDLYGSLSLTGKGHATDLAVMLGLSGQDPEYIPIENIDGIIRSIQDKTQINLGNEFTIPFDISKDIIFNKEFLPFHSNGMTFTAYSNDKKVFSATYYSIGGGFVVKEERINAKKKIKIKCAFPFPIDKAVDVLAYCKTEGKKISEIVYENEKSMRSEEEIDHELMRIWITMLECMNIGCTTEGILPGGLNVRRRAFDMHQNLIGLSNYSNQ